MAGDSEARVSVVIPTHNRRALLARTLRTVLRQEGVAVEVIVVDDGSTDGTAEAVAAAGDERVLVVRHDRPRGVAAARNTGLDRARAPWVAFVDDDDVWAPGKLAAQLEAAEATGARWSFVGAVVVDMELHPVWPQEPPLEPDVADLLLTRNPVPGGASGVMARTDLVREVGGFDTGLSNMADWDLWIRLALASPAAAVDRPLVGYFVHPDGMAHGVERSEEELVIIAARYADDRHERGIEIDWQPWLRYFGRLHLQAGRRVAATRTHLRLAWRHGAPEGWKLAVAGFVWPGVQRVRNRRRGERMTAAWRQEAESWLRPLRAETVSVAR